MEESKLKVAKDCVVSIHYTLTDETGEVIDSSRNGEPLKFLCGAGNIIPGLEKELEGCDVGEDKKVVVQPDQGYGEHDQDLVQTMPRNIFSGVDVIEVGMEFHAQGGSEDQVQSVVVTKVTETEVTVDGNHELAGKVLTFDVSIEDVREGTKEELDHGHVH